MTILSEVDGVAVRFATDHISMVICEFTGPSGTPTIGSAKCAPEDEFDTITGEMIAYVRALTAEAVTTLNALAEVGVSAECVMAGRVVNR